MSIEQAKALKPGDVVNHKFNEWAIPQVVESVNAADFSDDPVIFFKNGGFWRSSRLRKVEHEA